MDHLENAFASNGGKVWGLLRTSHTTSHPTCLEQNRFRARRLFESESLEELKVFKSFECFLAAHKQNLVNVNTITDLHGIYMMFIHVCTNRKQSLGKQHAMMQPWYKWPRDSFCDFRCFEQFCILPHHLNCSSSRPIFRLKPPGDGFSGFCELTVVQPWRPAFRCGGSGWELYIIRRCWKLHCCPSAALLKSCSGIFSCTFFPPYETLCN